MKLSSLLGNNLAPITIALCVMKRRHQKKYFWVVRTKNGSDKGLLAVNFCKKNMFDFRSIIEFFIHLLFFRVAAQATISITL